MSDPTPLSYLSAVAFPFDFRIESVTKTRGITMTTKTTKTTTKPRTTKPRTRKTPTKDLFANLDRPFSDQDVKWRVGRQSRDGKKAALLAYVDARSVQARFDGAVGKENWSVTYVPFGDTGAVMATVSVRINGEWVSKSDIGSPSNVEREKGAVSDAFKRASVAWGVGRHLYDLPETWRPIIAAKPSDPRAFWVKGGYITPPRMADFKPKVTEDEELKRFEEAIKGEFNISLAEAIALAGNDLDTRQLRVAFYTTQKEAKAS